MEFTIRPISDDDREGKAYVHYRSWLETYGAISVNNYIEQLNQKSFMSESMKQSAPTLVALVEDEVVGFIAYDKSKDQSEYDNWSEIYALYVLEEYQNHTIGYALTQRVLELTYPDNVTLWIVEENEHAINFYERIGFKHTQDKTPVFFGTTYQDIRMNYYRHQHESSV